MRQYTSAFRYCILDRNVSLRCISSIVFFSFIWLCVMVRMMLTVQRQGLHEVCASWYEKHYTHSMTYSSLITHHWLRSANTIKKVECLVSAAANAKKAGLNQEVIKYYSALISLAFGIEIPTSSICSLSRYWKYKRGEKEEAPMRKAQKYLSIISTKMQLIWEWLRDNASGKTKRSSTVERKGSNKLRLCKGEKTFFFYSLNFFNSTIVINYHSL